jgi:ZIP family zinc transporter
MFQKIIVFALIPVATMIAGGVIAVIKKPGGNLRSLILHFAAGVVFSVVGVEILPDILKNHLPFFTIIGFAVGFLAMTGIRHFAEKGEEIASITKGKIPWGIVTGIGVDIIIDGFLLGIAFAAGHTEGVLLAIALSVEFLSLGMATSTSLGNENISKMRSLITIVVLAALFFGSALLGAAVLRDASQEVMDTVLSFGLSALLFLITEELLKEAHEEKETIWHTSAFFFGFLVFLILGMYV